MKAREKMEIKMAERKGGRYVDKIHKEAGLLHWIFWHLSHVDLVKLAKLYLISIFYWSMCNLFGKFNRYSGINI